MKRATAKKTAAGSAKEPKVIRPQPGPQTAFLSSPADIVLYGGQAGGGKSWGLLLEPLRHVTRIPHFYAVVFRRTLADAKKPGATWDQMAKIYPMAKGVSNSTHYTYNFPLGGKVAVGHLEHEKTVLDWQSAEVPLFLFDELTHFSRSQFFYMLSRNRSTCGVRPYIRATCNPDADSWVADFIAWWIDDKGFAITERSGVVRWFVVLNDVTYWGDTRQELIDRFGDPNGPPEEQPDPKSFTFIGASIYDNKELLKKDPGYLANLKALPLVDQARLLGGNWKIRPAAGLLFRREWCEVVSALPHDLETVRYWDLGATEKTETNDPDWTVGVKMAKQRSTGLFFVCHVKSLRATPMDTETAWKNTASQDGTGVRIGFPQDPGQAGKSQAQYIVRSLAGFNVTTRPERGSKIVRFGPFSAQAQAGNIKVLRGDWNEEYFAALEAFPDANHDDHADASGGAFNMLAGDDAGILDFYQQQYEEEMARRAAAGT